MAMSRALTKSSNVGKIIWSDNISVYSRYAAVQIDVIIILNNDSNRFKYVVPYMPTHPWRNLENVRMINTPLWRYRLNILECYISLISRLPLVDLGVSMFWWVDLQQHMRRHASLWTSMPPLWHRQVEQVYRSWRHNYCVCMQGLSFCTYMISKVPCCAFSGAQESRYMR